MTEKFNLSPFGSGEIKEKLHKGKMFNVYRVHISGQDFCLKSPSNDLTMAGFNTSDGFGIGTSVYMGHNRIDSLPKNHESINSETLLQFATGILLAEAQIVNWTNGAWNHSIIGQGTWDGLSTCHDNRKFNRKEDSLLRFYPALLMPYHDSIPFSVFLNKEKRDLFLRMLPALWNALSLMYHGDLNESNLLIASNFDKFHIIDPGVILSSVVLGTLYINELNIFTTTPSNYPLLPPHVYITLNNSAKNTSGLIEHLKNIPSSVITHANPRIPKNGNQGVEQKTRPVASDLLALGIIYFRILTGNELFLGINKLSSKPVWEGNFNEFGEGIYQEYRRVIGILSENYIEKEINKYPLRIEEKELVRSLVNLEIRSLKHLKSLLPD